MSLEKIHKEYVIERLYRNYLYQGIVPTSTQLEADLATYQKKYLDLKQPTCKYEDFSVAYGGESSASKMNFIKETLINDINVFTETVFSIASDNQEFYDRWIEEITRMNNKAANLESRIDALLMLSQDSSGYFNYVSDIFTDVNNVDGSLTTARVNIKEGTVKIAKNRTFDVASSGGDLLDLSWLTEKDIIFNPVTIRGPVSFRTIGDNNPIQNIFKAENSKWIGEIVALSSKKMVCELKFPVSRDQLKKVSSASIVFSGPISSTKSNVTMQYSKDGYIWNLVPSIEATKPLSSLNWNFEETEMLWVKFIFYKPIADDSSGKFIYAIDSVNLYNRTYSSSGNNELVSIGLSAKDKEDNTVSFNKAALESCESCADETGIKYYLSASRDNEVWTQWIPVSSPTSKYTSYPKVVVFSGYDKKNSEEDAVKFDTSSLYKDITRTFDSGYTGYRFINNSFFILNSAIPIGESANISNISKTVRVWRNTPDKDASSYPSVSTVRGIPKGWGLDGSNYYCYFEVNNPAGLVFDFGKTQCLIDGSLATGIFLVPSGVHKFSTDVKNWFDIANNVINSSSAISSEERLISVDPLYPYNHKLLIEGFPYVTSFSGQKKYTGADISSQFSLKRVSPFELENNIKTYDSFSVVEIENNGSSFLGVLVKVDLSNSDYLNESFFVTWEYGLEEDASYKYIRLKAELLSSNKSKTPVLSSYKIKLG
jgi:hypothetical protein